MEKPTVYVPVALDMEAAEHTFGATKAVFDSCRALGRPVSEYAPLARAMMTLAEAIDKRREEVASEVRS